MTNFAYTQGIPATNNNPSDDQPDMLVNNDNSFLIWNVDHIGFNLANGGYHKLIHLPNAANGGPSPGGQTAWNPEVGSGPYLAIKATATAGIQQVFAMNYTPDSVTNVTDTQLFSMTGQGGLSQLTGNFGIENGGWQWFSGTLAIWGNGTSATSGSVIFKSLDDLTIPFPSAIFHVFTQFKGTNTNQLTLEITAKSLTGFSWQLVGIPTVGYEGFSFLAIGN